MIGSVGTTLVRPALAPADPRLDGWLAPGTEVPFHIDSAQAVDFLKAFMTGIPGCHAWVDLPDDGAVGDSADETASVLDDFRAGFSAQYPHRTAVPSLPAEIAAAGPHIPLLTVWVRGLGEAAMREAVLAVLDDRQRELFETSYVISPMGVIYVT